MRDLVKLRHEQLEVVEDVPAVEVPSGTETVLVAGTKLTLLQELGGDFTTRNIIGIMYRISGIDAQKIGKDVPEEAVAPESEGGVATEEDVWSQLRKCYDPEIPVNIVDLGLIYDCHLEELEAGNHKASVKMTLTAPGCGMGPTIQADVENKILCVESVDEVDVELVWEPQWTQAMMTEAARLELGMM